MQSVSQTTDQVSAIKTHTESSKLELFWGGKGHFKVYCENTSLAKIFAKILAKILDKILAKILAKISVNFVFL